MAQTQARDQTPRDKTPRDKTPAAAPALPTTAWAVLGLLSFERDLSGYDLKKWADASLRFFYWSPAASHIYTELRRLERLGYVSSRVARQDDLRNKRVYRITRAGSEALAAWLRTEPEPTIVKNNTLLRVWLGHLADPAELRAAVEHHRAELYELHADARGAAERAESDEAWRYPQLVTRWAVRRLELDLELVEELLADLDRVARSSSGPRRRSR